MKYELTLSTREDDEATIISFDTLKGDNLVEILSQLPYVVASLMRKLNQEKPKFEDDDDIPF